MKDVAVLTLRKVLQYRIEKVIFNHDVLVKPCLSDLKEYVKRENEKQAALFLEKKKSEIVSGFYEDKYYINHPLDFKEHVNQTAFVISEKFEGNYVAQHYTGKAFIKRTIDKCSSISKPYEYDDVIAMSRFTRDTFYMVTSKITEIDRTFIFTLAELHALIHDENAIV